MRVKNSIFFWVKFKNIINNRLRRFYLNTTYYNNKISKIGSKELVYKPNPSIINCIIKFKNKRNNINDFLLDTIWEGSFNNSNIQITWVEMGLRLQKKRSYHFSFVISNQIITFGGYNVEDDFLEIIEKFLQSSSPKEVEKATKVFFYLSNFAK